MLEGSNGFVLLDRDGVINVDRPDSVTRLEDLAIQPGAAEAAEMLVAGGYSLLVITNQAAVGRGDLDLGTLETINAAVEKELDGAITDWFICPHLSDDGCECRKPGTLLLEQAQKKYGFDPSATWFVADAGRDVEAALRFGCRPALVRTGKGRATEKDYPNIDVWDDLISFARWLAP